MISDHLLLLILSFLVNYVDCKYIDIYPEIDLPEQLSDFIDSDSSTQEVSSQDCSTVAESSTIETTPTPSSTTTEEEPAGLSVLVTDPNYFGSFLAVIVTIIIMSLIGLFTSKRTRRGKLAAVTVASSSSMLSSGLSKSSTSKLTQNSPVILPVIKPSAEFPSIKQDSKFTPLPSPSRGTSPSVDSIVSISSSQGVALHSDKSLTGKLIKSKIKKVTFNFKEKQSKRSSSSRRRSSVSKRSKSSRSSVNTFVAYETRKKKRRKSSK